MTYQDTIFSQLLSIIPRHKFNRFVQIYDTDKWCKKFTSWNHLVCMIYAQIRQRDSLREIEGGLDLQLKKLPHLGVQSVKRSTLSDANNRRDPRVFQALYYYLLDQFNKLAGKPIMSDKDMRIIDSSSIEVCYSLYPWAKMQRQKGGFKLHCLLNYKTSLPEFIHITDGLTNDIEFGKTLPIIPDSIYVFDKGYYDYAWFYSIHQQKATFVTRCKTHTRYKVIGQHPQSSLNNTSILSDEIIQLTTRRGLLYKEPLRLVHYYDEISKKTYQFLTNNLHCTGQDVAQIYKQRWAIELFFKWIKQNLKVKTFIGTSKNAVLTQIWIALITYVLVKYMSLKLHSKRSLSHFMHLLNELLFDRTSLIHVLNCPSKDKIKAFNIFLPLFSSA